MNQTLPLVSVIIPNYNYGRFLSQAIESVLNQTYSRIELIVVDDGSTDNSVNIAKKYGSSLRLLQQQNAGVSAARNLGLQATNGEFICFLDSDDSWVLEKIELQLLEFSNPDIGVVYSSINICDENLEFRETMPAVYRGQCSNLYYKYPIRSIILLGCSGAMIRRDVINQVGEFDSNLNSSADWDYFRRVANVTDVDFIETPLVNYRRHIASMSSGSLEAYYQDNEQAVIKMGMMNAKENSGLDMYGKSRYAWIKFQLGAAKALFKGKRKTEALWRVRKCFIIQPFAIRRTP